MRVLFVNDIMDYVVHGLLRGLARQGHAVKVVPIRRCPTHLQGQMLIGEARTFQPDLVLTPGWSIGIFDLIQYREAIRALNLFHVYWATEDPVFFERCSMQFAPYCDYVFTTTREFVPRYNVMGKPASVLLFGFNPEIHRKVSPDPKYAHDILLVANNYPWFPPELQCRRRAIKTVLLPLIEGDFDVKVFGVDWTKAGADLTIPPQYHGGYCNYLENSTAYSSAKIVLGLHSDDSSRTQTSVRTFEILGAGAFYLTYYTPAHENLFVNHKHLVWSKSPEETLDLVNYYLKHDTERERIAAAGHTLALAQHSYDQRAKQFESTLAPYLPRES